MEGNIGKTIPLFGSLNEENGMKHSFLLVPAKIILQICIAVDPDQAKTLHRPKSRLNDWTRTG
jgi:hypothetical protein